MSGWKDVVDQIEEMEDGLLVLEPREQFDPCLIGVVERFNQTFALYSKAKVLAALRDETDEEPEMAALEHYEFNILGGWVGDTTPGFLDDMEEMPVKEPEEGKQIRVWWESDGKLYLMSEGVVESFAIDRAGDLVETNFGNQTAVLPATRDYLTMTIRRKA